MKPRNCKQYKCLPFIVIFSMMLFICHVLFQNKFVLLSFGLLSLGSLFMPLYDVFCDIVTEVYGFNISMRIFWAKNFVSIIFNWFCYFFINLSSSSFGQSEKSYYLLLDRAPFIIFFGITFYIIAYRVNAYLLIKWKILLKGKYFWLRSFASTTLGLIIFNILFTPIWLWLGIVTNEKEAIQLSLSAFILRITIYLILAFPSTVVVNLLKIVEQVDVYEHGIKFNPFKKEKSVET